MVLKLKKLKITHKDRRLYITHQYVSTKLLTWGDLALPISNMGQRTFDIFLWFLVDCLEFKKNTWSYESNVRCGNVVELYQYRVIYGLPEGFCRSRFGAQECPDYSTMTERALHEKVWCSCCTQGLDNDMTALSFLNNCNCWNCHMFFKHHIFYSLNLGISGRVCW